MKTSKAIRLELKEAGYIYWPHMHMWIKLVNNKIHCYSSKVGYMRMYGYDLDAKEFIAKHNEKKNAS